MKEIKKGSIDWLDTAECLPPLLSLLPLIKWYVWNVKLITRFEDYFTNAWGKENKTTSKWRHSRRNMHAPRVFLGRRTGGPSRESEKCLEGSNEIWVLKASLNEKNRKIQNVCRTRLVTRLGTEAFVAINNYVITRLKQNVMTHKMRPSIFQSLNSAKELFTWKILSGRGNKRGKRT